jgi:hypothetical protein
LFWHPIGAGVYHLDTTAIYRRPSPKVVRVAVFLRGIARPKAQKNTFITTPPPQCPALFHPSFTKTKGYRPKRHAENPDKDRRKLFADPAPLRHIAGIAKGNAGFGVPYGLKTT